MTARVTAWSSTLAPGDGDPRHGLNGYSNFRCRCDICRAANSAYRRHMRRARKRRLDSDPTIRPHGDESTYLNYGCRCALCREAHRAADAARPGRRKGDVA